MTRKQFEDAKKASLEKWESAPIDDLEEAKDWWDREGSYSCSMCRLRHASGYDDWCENGCPIRQHEADCCCVPWCLMYDGFVGITPSITIEEFSELVDDMRKIITSIKFEDVPEKMRT